MPHHSARRNFLQKMGILSLGWTTRQYLSVPPISDGMDNDLPHSDVDLNSLSPRDILSKIDLDRAGLELVKKEMVKANHEKALQEFLAYYQYRYPSPEVKRDYSMDIKKIIARADDLGKHIFQWGPYESAAYGDAIDWDADPAGDIEWIASMHRFYWANDLADAYMLTGDDKYVTIFMELSQDWISKYRLEDTIDKVHPVYGPGKYGSKGWVGYAWLDLQTGIRATNICRCFKQFVGSPVFTSEFLAQLLASLYDHQVKTENIPMNMVHNKAIFEQRGFFNVLYTIPEFKDLDRWIEIGINTTSANLLAQTSSDGVQREWCGGYHNGVYRDAMEIETRVKALGRTMPEHYHQRIQLMAEHIFGISTPDLGFPMFGDTSRDKITSANRQDWQLYGVLIDAGEYFDEPKYTALAKLDIENLPKNGSAVYPDAGLVALRNSWSTDQVYMALHCSPKGMSSHDTPDNGTFELYAYGRWLMPDSGYYVYSHDLEAREWHRQTRIHATMTVNGEDSGMSGRIMSWRSDGKEDMVCMENLSYDRFTHRRTVWFVGKDSEKPFFVLLDEAIGDMEGKLELHFPMAPGHVVLEEENHRFYTDSGDINLMVHTTANKPIQIEKEQGWHAWKYGKREPRTMVTAFHQGRGPLVFITVLIPYKGKVQPDSRITTNAESILAGMDPVELVVEVDGDNYTLGREI